TPSTLHSFPTRRSSDLGFFKLRGHENKITCYYRINLRSVRFLLGPELADDCDYARKHWRQQRSLQRRASLDIDHDQNEDRIGRRSEEHTSELQSLRHLV